MKKYLSLVLLIMSPMVLAEQSLNNKTPVPTIEAAQASGLYEGVNNNPTMTKKQRTNKQRMQEKVDQQVPSEDHQRNPLWPSP